MKKSLFIICILMLTSTGEAEIPIAYQIVFESGFNSGVLIIGGNACRDRNTRYISGRDSITGFSWLDDFPGNPSKNFFNDVLVKRFPDCCPSGCTATSIDQCHTIELVSGIDQYGGGKGYALKGVLIKDCSAASYSRVQYNWYGHVFSTEPLENQSAYYAEIDMMIDHVEDIDAGQYISLLENYDGGFKKYGWKSALLLAHNAGSLKFYMKNYDLSGPFSQHYDNKITPESGKPFKLRFWYKASLTEGLWKATYTCPSCNTPIRETIIKEFKGQTIDERADLGAFAVGLLKAASIWDGLTIYWLNVKLGRLVNLK